MSKSILSAIRDSWRKSRAGKASENLKRWYRDHTPSQEAIERITKLRKSFETAVMKATDEHHEHIEDMTVTVQEEELIILKAHENDTTNG